MVGVANDNTFWRTSMSPAFHTATSSSAAAWRVFTHEKANVEFEIPSAWWHEPRGNYDLVAAPANESVPALSAKTVSMRYQTAEAAIAHEIDQLEVGWTPLDRSATIQNGAAIVQLTFERKANHREAFMCKAFIPQGDIALWMTAYGVADVWCSRIDVLRHALRTLIPRVLPVNQKKTDPFAAIYTPRTPSGYAEFDMIEFTR
jgi:hypothetical protein